MTTPPADAEIVLQIGDALPRRYVRFHPNDMGRVFAQMSGEDQAAFMAAVAVEIAT